MQHAGRPLSKRVARLIVIEAPKSGSGEELFATLRKAVLARFLKTAQRAVQLPGEVTVLLADDARLKTLNRTFRGKNKATDVLSFPAAQNDETTPADPRIAGDLAISVETAARQAAEHGHALEDELRVLTLHGLLHLAGYDHEVDRGEMRALESELRAKLKLPGGLIERAEPDVVRRAGTLPTRRNTKVVAHTATATKSAGKKSLARTAAARTASVARPPRGART